jgi:UDP-N-acetylmuramoyl-tripeptide--D-alanyl-D-alanine ligase
MNGFWTLRRVGAALDRVTSDDRRSARANGRTIGGSALDDRPIAGISTDTRTLHPGDAFVALRGEHFDGHEFVREALGRGAAALIVDNGASAAAAGVPVFVVDDTLLALGALARYHRTAWARPVVAIGGSNGKTTTKDLLRAILASRYVVHATPANLNNRIGVPQTLLAAPEDADVAVVEVGTNQRGEMAALHDIALADIAVVTTVQEEHLEAFGDLRGVLEEELTLCNNVNLAVVPADEPDVIAEARRRARNVVTAGLTRGDVRVDAHGLDASGYGWLEIGGVTIRVPAPGAHNLANTMLCVAVARVFGLSPEDVATGLANATLSPMRSAVEQIGDALLVNDAYNSNPASVRAALALLSAVSEGRPPVVVLGTMRELGAPTDVLHDEVARAAIAMPVRVIGAVGAFAHAFDRVAPNDTRVVRAEDPESLWPLLVERLDPRSAILLKASRGVRLERLVPRLREWAKRGATSVRAS